MTDLGPCREWPGSRKAGYGRIRWGARDYILVHRLVWSAAHGEIPAGMMILHKCDNPPCFRLDHLYCGTALDNMRDRKRAGHYAPSAGEANNHARLTEEAVIEIRRLYLQEGLNQTKIAKQFGITQPHVSAITRGKSWTHLS